MKLETIYVYFSSFFSFILTDTGSQYHRANIIKAFLGTISLEMFHMNVLIFFFTFFRLNLFSNIILEHLPNIPSVRQQ